MEKGVKKADCRFTVRFNGRVIYDDFTTDVLPGLTSHEMPKIDETDSAVIERRGKLEILHANGITSGKGIRFRNIWILPKAGVRTP